MSTRHDHRRKARLAAQRAATAYRCPDCLAQTSVSEPLPGVFVLDVLHDPTCPYGTSAS